MLADPHRHRELGVRSYLRVVDPRFMRMVPGMHHRDYRPGLCRWCAKPVPRRRKTFCSDECVWEFNFRADSTLRNAHIWQRDHGVCQLCGTDIAKLGRICLILRYDVDLVCFAEDHEKRYRTWRPGSVERELLLAVGYSKPKPRRALWEVDHIVPVSRGGGFCGPDNLRLLCSPCHLDVTKQQRQRG